jgi:hypothetical protein
MTLLPDDFEPSDDDGAYWIMHGVYQIKRAAYETLFNQSSVDNYELKLVTFSFINDRSDLRPRQTMLYPHWQ